MTSSNRIPAGSRTLARTIGVAAAATSMALSASGAVADGPVMTVPAAFTEVTTSGGTLLAAWDRVFSSAGTGTLAGHSTVQRYCTPYGSGTTIVGFRMAAGRWHVEHGNAAVMILHSGAGELRRIADVDLPHNRADSIGLWAGAAPAMAPSDCVWTQVVVRNRIDAPLLWTSALQEVAIRDDVGPTVSDAVVRPAGWITGGDVAVDFTTADNGLHRGGVQAQVGSGPIHDLGDVANGRTSATLPLDGIADGQHQLVLTRSGWGWAPRSASAVVMVDRTAPGIPVVATDTTSWTNADRVAFHAAPTADATSGWRLNEFSVDGGGWTDEQPVALSAEGVHRIRARAVDHAGNRSAPSDTALIRIDRTPPLVEDLQVSGVDPAGVRAQFSLSPDAGAPYTGCPISVEIAPAGGRWTEALRLPSSDVSGRVNLSVPVATASGGQNLLRLTVCDAAGNRSQRTVRFHRDTSNAATASEVQRTAADPSSLTLSPIRVKPVPFGARVVIRSVVRRNGRASAAVPVTLSDPAGRTIGSMSSDAAGRVVFRLRATRGGVWTLHANQGGTESARTANLVVRPRVRWVMRPRMGWTALRAGIRPGLKGRIVRVQRRQVGGWVTVASVRTGPAGRVLARRQWSPGRYRLAVPRQSGWSLAPTAAPFRVGS
ncbi:MAG: hypothetical protein KDC36_10405 [Thermoleophilia bacterium]|nr:hypothetical protein [Thermoleophilia bacterium]